MENQQGMIFKGIYDFEDPSGILVAAKSPIAGNADLYSGTTVIVKPSQIALFIYKGQIAEVLPPGNHQVKTENFPILTRLASWQFDFESPLRCEIWFFSTGVFVGRRWGTSQPIICDFPGAHSVPIRAFGIYNVVLRDPSKFFLTLVGSKTSCDITEIETLVQSQITELLPKALSVVPDLAALNKSQAAVAQELLAPVNATLQTYGIELVSLQIISLVPSQEVLDALDSKVAMDVIGNKQEYLLYKAANSLEANVDGKEKGSSDSMQLMMGLMLGKSFMDLDFKEKEKVLLAQEPAERLKACPKCNAAVKVGDKFCSSCGGQIL